MRCFSCLTGKNDECPVCYGSGQFVDKTYIESNERYTLPQYIAMARSVMGSIDLDPASSAIANKTVQATQYYTRQQNGLKNAWYGNVWLNPPYGKVSNSNGTGTFQKYFIEKMLHEYNTGNVQQAILLLLGIGIYNQYFLPLWDYTICLDMRKVHFSTEDGKDFDHGYGTCFIYLGKDATRFKQVFAKLGPIVGRIY